MVAQPAKCPKEGAAAQGDFDELPSSKAVLGVPSGETDATRRRQGLGC